MTTIEERLRRLEDRAELQDLVVRYFIAADDDDYDTLAEVFAPDCSFSASGFEGTHGREAVVENLRVGRTYMGATLHTPNYALFTFQSDDHASGVVGAHLELAMAGKTLFGAVRYTDEYVRWEGRWRFRRREMRCNHIGPWEDVATSLTDEFCVRWPGIPPKRSDFPKKL
jgi:3-phenylpropionate/cinnamic acid dioxygenase small subunit